MNNCMYTTIQVKENRPEKRWDTHHHGDRGMVHGDVWTASAGRLGHKENSLKKMGKQVLVNCMVNGASTIVINQAN